MITATVHTKAGYNSENGKRYNDIYDIRCLSTDTKPQATNGSTCIEIDTGKKYLFDAVSGEWNEIDSSITINPASGVSF